MNENSSLRETFDGAAQDYDAVRPGYPASLIQDIIALSRLPAGGRILEVGCGTGQATLPFAQRGYPVLCLDIGEQLAAIARRTCLPYPGVRILVASFEDWPAEENAFDLVMSATAFHWISPAVGYPKAARVLKDSGHIAIFSNLHPTPYTGFFVEVQEAYQRFVPGARDVRDRPSTEEVIASSAQQIDDSGLFGKVIVKQYPWTHTYTAEQYIRLLNTYSDHLALEESRRKGLYAAIHDMITTHYGGKIVRPYHSVLYIAEKGVV